MSIYFHYRRCRTPVARIEDYLGNVLAGGIFKTVFNVEVSDTVNNHPTLDGSTLANAYCVQCKELLGGKFIAVDQPKKYWFVIEGRFLMNTNKLMRNEDQDGDITGLDEDALDQDGDTSDQNGDGIDQHGDTTEKNGNANDQCGETPEQDGDANEQNANQDLGTNKQNADQDLSDNGQNADQNLGASGQNADQDGDANEQVPKEQDVGAKQNDDDEMEASQ